MSGSRNLFQENSLLGLFHSKKISVTFKNLYLLFNLKHKHLVISFTVKGIRILIVKHFSNLINLNMIQPSVNTVLFSNHNLSSFFHFNFLLTIFFFNNRSDRYFLQSNDLEK